MMIIGCDFHPSWQQIAWVDTETGETGEQKLGHASGEARKFYEQLRAPVLVGMEATGNSQWFVEMVEDLGHAIWIGDAAAIRASYVRRQKTDKRDAAHILRLLREHGITDVVITLAYLGAEIRNRLGDGTISYNLAEGLDNCLCAGKRRAGGDVLFIHAEDGGKITPELGVGPRGVFFLREIFEDNFAERALGPRGKNAKVFRKSFDVAVILGGI